MTEATTAQITARIAHIRHVYGDADQDATLLEALLEERDRKAAKPADGINAAIDRAAEQTRQAYIKRGMFAREAIEHLVRLLCVEIAASQPAPALDVTHAAPDAHQPDLVAAGAQQAQAMQNPATFYGNPGEIVVQRDLAVRSAQKRSAELDAMRDQIQELRRKANASEARASHLQSALDRMKAQPLTVQDAVRVPEIAPLIEARRHHVETVKTYNAKLKSVEMQRLNDDWSQNVATEYFEMNEAHRDFIAAAQTAADAALRAIAEGK